MDLEKLKKLRGGASDSVRTGGKGSVRRKKKAAHKAQATDDKRLQSTLKRLGVNAIPGIEEVNIFKGDEVRDVLRAARARVGAALPDALDAPRPRDGAHATAGPDRMCSPVVVLAALRHCFVRGSRPRLRARAHSRVRPCWRGG